MDNASAAKIGGFDIGPTTIYGRAVAIRVLFCNSTENLFVLIRDRTKIGLRRLRKVLLLVLRAGWTSFNPRNPGVLLGTAILGVLIMRRYRYRFLEAEVAIRKRFWSNLMQTALTYDEWAHAAGMLEKYQWRRRVRCSHLQTLLGLQRHKHCENSGSLSEKEIWL